MKKSLCLLAIAGLVALPQAQAISFKEKAQNTWESVSNNSTVKNGVTKLASKLPSVSMPNMHVAERIEFAKTHIQNVYNTAKSYAPNVTNLVQSVKSKASVLQSSQAGKFISATGAQALTHLQSSDNIGIATFFAGTGLLFGTGYALTAPSKKQTAKRMACITALSLMVGAATKVGLGYAGITLE